MAGGGVRLEERLDAVLFSTRKVSTRVLNLIQDVMSGQRRKMRSRVTWECLGRLKTNGLLRSKFSGDGGLRMLVEWQVASCSSSTLRGQVLGLAAGWNAQTGIS